MTDPIHSTGSHTKSLTVPFYSLLETAKLAGLEPADYLAQAARRAIASPGTVTLPHLLAEASYDP